MAMTHAHSSRLPLCRSIEFLRVLALLSTLLMASAAAQTLTVLHTFSYDQSEQPQAGVVMDRYGSLYGTTTAAGSHENGEAFKMTPHGAGWIFQPLIGFPVVGSDHPEGPLLIAPDGTLYGTVAGYSCPNCGVVFRIGPPPTVSGSVFPKWNVRGAFPFSGSDGSSPSGALLRDAAGNLYGTTQYGGPSNDGVIYQLAHGSWQQTILYSPQSSADGITPMNGVVSDAAGNLYGVFKSGGPNGFGEVFELSQSGGIWTKQVLYAFTGGDDGAWAISVILDPAGNLYGGTEAGGSGHGGTVFKLSPGNGGWNFSLLYSFTGSAVCGVNGRLTMDGAGNLYGATSCDGAYGFGSIFKMTPSGGNYTFADLHDFMNSDSAYPNGDLVLDSEGNIYGTTEGGTDDGGTVFEITP